MFSNHNFHYCTFIFSCMLWKFSATLVQVSAFVMIWINGGTNVNLERSSPSTWYWLPYCWGKVLIITHWLHDVVMTIACNLHTCTVDIITTTTYYHNIGIVYTVPLPSTGKKHYMLVRVLMDLSTVLFWKLRSYLGMLSLQLYKHLLAGLWKESILSNWSL